MEQKVKILIIDDEDIVLKSCLRILKNDRYEIQTAYSGDEGLKLVAAQHVDIVITDIKMPGTTGMEVLEKLKKDKPEITVIIFTGYATVENAREALKKGAFDYIPKPFTKEELTSVVDNAVKARSDKSDAKMLDLMAIVSHEMKSPVNTMHTTAETLYRGYFGNLEPKQREILEKIIRNCQYLEDIMRTYIDLAKVDLDTLESFNEKIDLIKDVIQPVIDDSNYNDNLKKMPLITHFKTKPIVVGDPNLLLIVVNNLVNNAIKYGKEGTEIKIDVYSDKGQSVVSVYNEGVGISKDDMEKKLFKKFIRLKQAGTEGVKGSGMGLYLCRKIIEKHNGRIWAESEPGKYVKFLFSIPNE